MAGVIPGISNRTLVMTFLIALAAIWAVDRNLFGIGNLVAPSRAMRAA